MDIWNTKQKYLIISTVKYKEIPEDTALLKKGGSFAELPFFRYHINILLSRARADYNRQGLN